MSKAKIVIIAFILAIVVAFSTALGLIGYFSNGFKDWSFIGVENNTPVEQPPIEDNSINKQIVKTILETEDYGTFILPTNHIKSSYGYVFPNGTNLEYFIKDYFVLNGTNPEEIAEVLNLCKVVAYFDDDVQNYFNVTEIHNSLEDYGVKLYAFENNEFNYTYSGDATQVIDSIHFLLMYEETEIHIIDLKINVFVEEYSFYNLSFSRAIVSDIGVPLTELIYKNIMSNSKTKITYEYDI